MFETWRPEARILIVDNEPANLRFLEELLARSGYSNVISTSEPRQAEMLFQAFQPDLVLLDWLMPDMNGYDVLIALSSQLQQHQYLPILVLTVDISREAWQIALTSGAKDFLVKPLDVTEVLLRIRNLLETRYLYRILQEQNAILIKEIGERKQVESTLRESETKFRTMFRSAQDILILVDSVSHEIIDINPAVQTVLGYSEFQLRNQPFQRLLHAEAGEINWEYLATSHTSLPREYTMVRNDGSLCPVDLTIASIAWDQQPYFLVTAHDASERKKVESGMLQALTREKELNELKSQFIAMATHEFSQPLATIRFLTDLFQMSRNTITEEKRQQHLKTIHQSINRMIELTEAIMLIGRSDSGRLLCIPEPLNLVNFSKELLEKMKLTIDPQHKVVTNFEISNPRILLDPHLLTQILTNLLSNAVKYSPEGGTVTFDIHCDEQQAIFKVSDEGIGIPPDAQANLFSTFFRANNVGKIPGHGLGLAIVQRCVHAHDGNITVNSVVGEGTTFTVTIPLNRELDGGIG